MSFEGGDLLLTGIAWPTVGSLPRPVCAVAWVAGRFPLVTRERTRGGWSARCAIQIDVLPLRRLTCNTQQRNSEQMRSRYHRAGTTSVCHLYQVQLHTWLCKLPTHTAALLPPGFVVTQMESTPIKTNMTSIVRSNMYSFNICNK